MSQTTKGNLKRSLATIARHQWAADNRWSLESVNRHYQEIKSFLSAVKPYFRPLVAGDFNQSKISFKWAGSSCETRLDLGEAPPRSWPPLSLRGCSVCTRAAGVARRRHAAIKGVQLRSRCRQTSGELPVHLNSGELVALFKFRITAWTVLALAAVYGQRNRG